MCGLYKWLFQAAVLWHLDTRDVSIKPHPNQLQMQDLQLKIKQDLNLLGQIAMVDIYMDMICDVLSTP